MIALRRWLDVDRLRSLYYRVFDRSYGDAHLYQIPRVRWMVRRHQLVFDILMIVSCDIIIIAYAWVMM